jgi:TIR domain
VFLCHSKLDEQVVGEVHERLQAAGVRCWFDDNDIAPDGWITEEIDRGLTGSRFVLACLSENFKKSVWAQRELRSRLHGMKKPDSSRLLVLMLSDGGDKDDVLTPLMRDHRRFSYRRDGQFEQLVEYILGSRGE